MRRNIATILLLVFPALMTGQDVPAGFGQLENAPAIFRGGVDPEGRTFFYRGQSGSNGKIILTASNGFFTSRTCRAGGESDLPKVGDDDLIKPNFACLDWTGTGGSLRWHLYLAKPGKVRFNIHLGVTAAREGARITASLADRTREVISSRSGGIKPQNWNIEFELPEPGEVQFSLRADRATPAGIGELRRIDVFGPAVEGARLLRARWRPAAVHGRYDTARVGEPRVLVVTTRSVSEGSSYSPVTTPFGYFGTSFGDDRRSSGHFNFSMWGRRGAGEDLRQMPHLLGVGSPEGEFSGFGHEGSGVKARGWEPMPDHPEVCIQALRVVPGKSYDSYYGYYFDHPSNSWKFYCAGNKWHGGKPIARLRLGSFCEVPGPPQSQRSGDIYREVRRRVWGRNNGKWIPLEQYIPGSGKNHEPVNKKWHTTADGEYAMGCGGIRLFRHDENLVKPAPAPAGLPYYLQEPGISRIFSLPVRFGKIETVKVEPGRAIVEINLPGSHGASSGAVYYGSRDALTFAPRELHGTERNSGLSREVNAQSWEQVVGIEKVTSGMNRVTLTDLEPSGTYYFRVLLNGPEARVWNDRTMRFTTPQRGISSPAY